MDTVTESLLATAHGVPVRACRASVRSVPVRASCESAPDGATTNPASVCRVPVRASLTALVLVLLLAVSSGCGRREEAPPAPVPLARVGGAVISAEDVAAEARRLRAAGQPAGDAQAVLQALILREAMLQEASTSTWANAQEARRERENLLLAQWLEHTLQAEKERVALADDDLRHVYEANAAEFTRPAMARLAILHRKPSALGADSSAEALTAALRQARQKYLDDPSQATRSDRIPGFGAIAAEASEHATSRYRGGDLGWLEAGRDAHSLPAEVVEAGFALPVGGVSDVLATETGLYVVMKQDQRESRIAPFEEVAATLRRRLLGARRDAVESTFKSNVLARADIQIDMSQASALTLPQTTARIPAPPALVPVARLAPALETPEAASTVDPGKEETE